jgi:hypothetical protein
MSIGGSTIEAELATLSPPVAAAAQSHVPVSIRSGMMRWVVP